MTPNKTLRWYWFNLSPRARLTLAAWLLIVALFVCVVAAGVVVR